MLIGVLGKYDMRAHEVLCERDIPTTRYGYWISPEGDIDPVGFEGHYDYMIDNYQMQINDAIRNGWIRVVSPSHTLYAEVGAFHATVRAISTLRKLVTSSYFDSFIIEIIGAEGTGLPDNRRFNEPNKFLNLVQQCKSRRS